MVELIRGGVPEAAIPQGSYFDKRAEITSKVSARGHPLFFGILPNLKNVKRNRVVNSVINVRLCTGRLMISSAKNRKRMVTKVQSQN